MTKNVLSNNLNYMNFSITKDVRIPVKTKKGFDFKLFKKGDTISTKEFYNKGLIKILTNNKTIVKGGKTTTVKPTPVSTTQHESTVVKAVQSVKTTVGGVIKRNVNTK